MQDPPVSRFGEKIDLEIALKPEEFWDRDATVVMGELAGIVQEGRMLAVQNGRLGNRWAIADGRFVIAYEDSDEDAAVAQLRETREAHKRLMEKAQQFAAVATSIEDIYGWEGFSNAWTGFIDAQNAGSETAKEYIERLYDTTVTLGSFLQADNDLRKFASGNSTCLSPMHRRAFEDLIRSASPFVRRFPSAREMDEELGGLVKSLSYPLAHNLLDSAAQKSLLSDEDRQLIVSLLKALANKGPEGEKAAKRGYFSVINLTTVAGIFGGAVFGAVVGDTLKEVDHYNRTIEWLGENVEVVLEVMEDLPVDLRATLESVLEDIQKDRQLPSRDEDVKVLTFAERRKKRPPRDVY